MVGTRFKSEKEEKGRKTLLQLLENEYSIIEDVKINHGYSYNLCREALPMGHE